MQTTTSAAGSRGWLHILHPRDNRQSVCGVLAEKVSHWETEYPPRIDVTCEDCYTLLPEAERPDDYNHPPGDPAIVDTCRRIVQERQHAKVDGVIIDLWSASVTVMIWDRLKDHHKAKLLALPSWDLVKRCVAIYAAATRND